MSAATCFRLGLSAPVAATIRLKLLTEFGARPFQAKAVRGHCTPKEIARLFSNRMALAISSIGLATAQGSSADISKSSALRAPEQWPWPVNGWSTSRSCRPAVGVSPGLNGIGRWQAIVQLALKDCFGDQSPSSKTPIFIGSCNGSAGDFNAEDWGSAFDPAALLEGTAWAGQRLPIFSGSCNSGLHALYAAGQVLMSGQAEEVVVLAADILSRSNQDNFEVLRVLADSPMLPWHPTSAGFILGEAAVALRITRGRNGLTRSRLTIPVLSHELTRADGLERVLERCSTVKPQLLLGQGTGPLANDESELAAFQRFFSRDVPLTTSLVHFGHTLGASGLLGIALAELIQQTPTALSALVMPTDCASDGRRLNTRMTGENGAANNETGDVIVTCRALNGSCAAAIVGHTDQGARRQETQTHRQPQKIWPAPVPTGPLMSVLLRQLASEAAQHRPIDPPDVLLVHLETPLAPPLEARIGGRLLPSAVLEMTPGFVPQLLARCWGFAGPALCLVGQPNVSEAGCDFSKALNDAGLVVAHVHLAGTGDKREIVWTN